MRRKATHPKHGPRGKANPPRTAPAAPKNAPSLDVRVTDVAFGGDGLVREEGKVIFVEAAIPGDHVRIQIYENKKNYARAKVEALLEASPDSREAFCPVFGRCGGCYWQRAPYPKQLLWKAQFVEAALRKITGVEQSIRIVPSPEERHYRNRIRLKVDARQGVGYFARSSHSLIRIDSCPIADPGLSALIPLLQRMNWASYSGEVELQALAEGRRLLHFQTPLPASLREQLAAQLPPDCALSEAGRTYLLEESQGLRYLTQAGQFQQVNVPSNRYLRDWVEKWVASQGIRSVVDLFCGSGNLSLGLAKSGVKVWGLEVSETAIATAQVNLQENQVQGASYKAGFAHAIRQVFPDLPDALDCVITDPPRQGMAEALDAVLNLKPRHILSISCDPNTFARDLKALLAAGYELLEVFALDFFPQTFHVESVAHLRRRED